MSAFNILEVELNCPHCNTTQTADLQFRYGHVWQLRYHVGDRIRWGGNDVGVPAAKRVIVEGLAGPCPSCGADFLEFDIVIDHDVIVAVEPVAHREAEAPDGYRVMDE